ncbi:MAG: SPASM domain-containing protein [Alphaproteobacteria bacterium]|nr:SPASM domain-containing protein [Alphaproteobacteria bacterium]MDX5415348.1 SPASM domain-containing protein [Alphaproteobacteria bacterium]MDX5492563.1 SPASM domain-containing protein [Alphaproteobacteria bacterium]
MESVYYVLTYACHRKCRHCYDTRFRPYVRDELSAVVGEGTANFRRIVANLPDSMIYRDPSRPNADGSPSERIGRIIMAGGELLIDPVREALFYPAMDAVREKYGRNARISMQTTGDVLTPRILDEMCERGVWMVAIASLDDYHVGMEGTKREPFVANLTAMFEAAGFSAVPDPATGRDHLLEDGPFYVFFGAQPGKWIAELWPRGRAWENGLSSATMATNFCARWSGAKNFLNHGYAGSEIAIEPNGDVFPCCLKTKLPIGNLLDERLIDILDSLKGHPVFEALNAGDPLHMGETLGWNAARFEAASHTKTPQGAPYANLCIGCDRLHEEVLGPVLAEIRENRMRRAAG